jgi:hypothetical protein
LGLAGAITAKPDGSAAPRAHRLSDPPSSYSPARERAMQHRRCTLRPINVTHGPWAVLSASLQCLPFYCKKLSSTKIQTTRTRRPNGPHRDNGELQQRLALPDDRLVRRWSGESVNAPAPLSAPWPVSAALSESARRHIRPVFRVATAVKQRACAGAAADSCACLSRGVFALSRIDPCLVASALPRLRRAATGGPLRVRYFHDNARICGSSWSKDRR